jgi:TRC40/GET3/ArsA family transport-energizing ATPase
VTHANVNERKDATPPATLSLLRDPPPFLFFTGKGGVGKTSLACACALALAGAGRRVLLVSTDPASNLDEMLGVALSDRPRAIPGAPGLDALNIDPGAAAEAYRLRVIEQMGAGSTEAERGTVREQLSGACTTEIAAFDEFVGLLAGDADGYDHVVFDTAPTGHTLRLLSLPKAWTGFLEGNDRGASCLGPHSGLKMQEQRFRDGLAALADPARTAVVLVTRADPAALREAARTHGELLELGLRNQRLVVNAVFRATAAGDDVAAALQALGERALAAMPARAASPSDCKAVATASSRTDALNTALTTRCWLARPRASNSSCVRDASRSAARSARVTSTMAVRPASASASSPARKRASCIFRPECGPRQEAPRSLPLRNPLQALGRLRRRRVCPVGAVSNTM